LDRCVIIKILESGVGRYWHFFRSKVDIFVLLYISMYFTS